MNLRDLIAALEVIPPAKIIRHGFGRPNSYRGYYEDLAFAPAENVTAESMLVHARAALGSTYTGYKGGEYTMHQYTNCWIAEYGRANGDAIGDTLVRYWMEDAP